MLTILWRVYLNNYCTCDHISSVSKITLKWLLKKEAIFKTFLNDFFGSGINIVQNTCKIVLWSKPMFEDLCQICLDLFGLVQKKDLLDLMLKSEFAVVPSSTILYELCCANTPCLSGYYVENQRRIHDGFLQNEALYSMGNIAKFEVPDFVPYIREILAKKNHHNQLKNQRILFDDQIKTRYLKLIEELW